MQKRLNISVGYLPKKAFTTSACIIGAKEYAAFYTGMLRGAGKETMNINDLKKEVAGLGFESDIEDHDCFIASANRALDMIYTDKPAAVDVKLSAEHPSISFHKSYIEHHAGEELTFKVNGKGLYFRSSGVGECHISASNGGSIILFEFSNQMSKAMLRGDATLTFCGDYYYTVSDLTVFGEVLGASILGIPSYTDIGVIDMTEQVPDFKCFASPVRDDSGEVISSAVLRDGRIILPDGFRGNVNITYCKAPSRINPDDENIAIDIPEDTRPLLPLLTAAFMWLDDDPSKAQYYMNLYREYMAGIRRYSSTNIDTEYRVNGWA